MSIEIVTERWKLKAPCFKLEVLESELPRIMEAYNWVSDPANKALGLAAPQVGATCSWFVMKNPSNALVAPPIIIVVNPRMELRGKPVVKIEACFSNPGESSPTLRWPQVFVKYSEVDPVTGEMSKRKVLFSGRTAQIFQHEFNHLKGRCIFDKPE